MMLRLKQKLKNKTFWSLVLVGAFVAVFVPITSFKAQPDHEWPLLITKNDLYHVTDPVMIEELAKYDIVILNLDAWRNTPDAIRTMRTLNPEIKLLANIQISEIDATWANYDPYNVISHGLYKGVDSGWWLRNTEGKQMYYYGEQFPMINLTRFSPTDMQGRVWGDWLAEYMVTVYNRPEFKNNIDGLFLDVSIDDMDWYNESGKWDIDRNGKEDSGYFVNREWKKGLHETTRKLREALGPETIFISNGQNTTWKWSNGQLDEDYGRRYVRGKVGFEASRKFMEDWEQNVDYTEKTNAVWSYADNATDWKTARYGITSAAMFNAYFAWSVAWTPMHNAPLWLDEYNADLGTSQGPAKKLRSGVWQRTYERGTVFVNPTDKNILVTLEFPMTKLQGTQDTFVNNGETVSSVFIHAKDGIVLLHN